MLHPDFFGTASESFCASYSVVSRPGAKRTPEHILFQDNRHGLPCYTHTAGVHHSAQARKFLSADLLPPHIYSHRKFPQPAGVQKLNKYNSLLPLMHTVLASRLTSIILYCPFIVVVQLRITQWRKHIDTHETTIVEFSFSKYISGSLLR